MLPSSNILFLEVLSQSLGKCNHPFEVLFPRVLSHDGSHPIPPISSDIFTITVMIFINITIILPLGKIPEIKEEKIMPNSAEKTSNGDTIIETTKLDNQNLHACFAEKTNPLQRKRLQKMD